MSRLLIFGGGGIADGIESVWDPMPCLTLDKQACDVTHAESVIEALEEHEPSYVVCTAGVDDEENPAKTIETNLLGSYNVARYSYVPTVLIASVAGMYGKPDHPAYCASKAGVISLAQSYAMMGKQIWALSPGRVDTPMREKRYPDDKPNSRLRREQVGYAVLDLLYGNYPPGINLIIRKKGFTQVILQEHDGDGWKDRLYVGQAKVI